MAKKRVQKESDLQELEGKLKDAKSVVFVEYRGTSVKNMDKFRKTLRGENIFSKVYKLTLLRKAMESQGISAAGVDYKTPVILSVSQEEETAPARLIKGLSKEIPTIKMLAGILDGQVASKEQLAVLADLPSKDVMRGQLVRTINAPVSGFVNVLAGNLRGLINVLNAVAQK